MAPTETQNHLESNNLTAKPAPNGSKSGGFPHKPNPLAIAISVHEGPIARPSGVQTNELS